MNDARPLPLSGRSGVYRFRKVHAFRPGIKHWYRLITPIVPCLAGVGWLYQAIATLRDRREYAPPGTLVSGGDCHLHLFSAGEGVPSVILESGLGGMCSGWGWVLPEVAKFTRVVSYDRAGLGWSGPDPGPKSAVLAARRLRAALRELGIRPPFVLVGHSMGGLFIRVFADLFRDVTAGMDVLPGQPELQSELAELSCDSVHLIVRSVNHVTLVTRREHALRVVDAIRHVVHRGTDRPVRGGGE